MTTRTFRRRLQRTLTPALQSAHPDSLPVIREMIDRVCDAFKRGGLTEARRTLIALKVD